MPMMSRRSLLAAGVGLLHAPPLRAQAAPATKPVPSSGEALPMIGLGSWITFNVGDDAVARRACGDVIAAFAQSGGRMIDSSPMYGSSQGVIGEGLARWPGPAPVFAADKVWISQGSRGPEQIEASRRLWRVPRFGPLPGPKPPAWQDHLAHLPAI